MGVVVHDLVFRAKKRSAPALADALPFVLPTPFALSLSKGLPFIPPEGREREGFDRLSPNG
jgi:hypothetical protein